MHLAVFEVTNSTELGNCQVHLVAKKGARLLGHVCPNGEQPGLLSRADETGWLSSRGAALVAVDVHAARQEEAETRAWPPTAPFQSDYK